MYQIPFFLYFGLVFPAMADPKTMAQNDWKLPPGSKHTSALSLQLQSAWKERSSDYSPRTKHTLTNGEPKYINELFLQTSPYLKQHAHNPVDWRPWSPQALAEAKAKRKMIFLSVGYATCHWCHVMEEESFEDEEIAKYINENYIPIKVDREERPDIDAIYMRAVRTIKGRGGWPMSVWLTDSADPFYAETYIPPRNGDRGREIGFLTLLENLTLNWILDPDQVYGQAEKVTQKVKYSLSKPNGGPIPKNSQLDKAVSLCENKFDAQNGGVKGRPKFPSSLPIPFLLQMAMYGDKNALRMAKETLHAMRKGGLYDQIGGGFHRYSVDEKWLVPHFEKMLYDNAQLALDYLQASRLMPTEDFAQTATEILDYVSREMTSSSGAFYSATDADSMTPNGHREEGYFFTWTPVELRQHLTLQEMNTVQKRFNVSTRGNFEGRNILHVAKSVTDIAVELGISVDMVKTNLKQAKEKLYFARLKRPQPLLDDKILTAWNGLMIAGFARAGFIMEKTEYINIAKRSANFILQRLIISDQLFRSHAQGVTGHIAYVEDHAFLIDGLLALFEATGEAKWLQAALHLDTKVQQNYEDPQGGWYRTHRDYDNLLVREVPTHDGAEPSGASYMLTNLLRLYALTTTDSYRQRAQRAFIVYGQILDRYPLSLDDMLIATHWKHHPPQEVYIIAKNRAQAEPLIAVYRGAKPTNRILVISTKTHRQALEKLLPALKDKKIIDQKATAYVCREGTCQQPTTKPTTFLQQLAAEK